MLIHPRLSPRSRQAKNMNLGYLVVGILLGFLASSFLSLVTKTEEDMMSGSTNNIIMMEQYREKRRRGLSLQSSSSAAPQNDKEEVGWKRIHVYVGPNVENDVSQIAQSSTIPTDYFHSTKWFSQLRQDEVVATLFRNQRNLYFVDLAANDAVRISNTFALEANLDWTGIAIEPNAAYWSSLSYRKCHVVAAVVGKTTNQSMRFKFPKRAAPQGGLVGQDFDNHKPGNNKEEDQMRYTVTLRDIFERFQAPRVINYLSLDVEGAESFVMESFPFDRYLINVLTIERANDSLRSLLERNGYLQLKLLKHWGETLWIHSSVKDSLDIASAMAIDTEHYKYREHVVQ